ncbi:general transcription factor II-I repeat domain-containing protein 2-like isoform X3 [Tachypleus tridentatus]|uniref:general transcription factor II-I repeat domain-containing protein 2-like isoform X3 n=1 Tax=Tachypleus tridentatus TaxID=6853 RepID=UPI003FD160C9
MSDCHNKINHTDGRFKLANTRRYDKKETRLSRAFLTNRKILLSSLLPVYSYRDPIFFSPIVMTPFRRREVDSECRAFNEEWGEKYFFVETKNQKATCVMCTESVAILKEYNLRRHYETKHRSTYLKFSGKFRSEKFESMIRVFGKVMLFVTS